MRLPLLEVLDRNFSKRTPLYEQFAKEKDQCKACSVCSVYKQGPVQSEGCADLPSIMIVGEAPGNNESEEGRPFIGQAGEVIRTELRKYSRIFNPKTTLITNVLLCRPINNKFPTTDEPKTCTSLWLDREIRLLTPKCILCLGNTPLKFLREQTGITKHRGTWKYLSQYDIWSFATYHPSYVMRCERSKNLEEVQKFKKDIEDFARECANRLFITGEIKTL